MERTLARYLSIKFLFIACLRDETEEIKETLSVMEFNDDELFIYI